MAKTKKVAADSRPRKLAAKPRSQNSLPASRRGHTRKSQSDAQPDQAAARFNSAVRLTFSYDGPAVKLLSQERVEMVIPPSDPLQGFAKHKGFWAELKDEEDRTLYRQVIHNPTRNDAEVFPDPEGNPDQSITRERAPKRKGVFEVLVPDLEAGHSVTMCRSPLDKTGPGRGVRSLASKPATKFRRILLEK